MSRKPNSDIRKVYKKIARKYAETYFGAEHPDDIHVDKFAKLLPKGAKVLDIGCGIGDGADFFIDSGFDYEGIDISPEMIKIAKQKVPRAKFRVLDMRKLDYPAESFDGIFAFQSLVHLKKKDVPKMLETISRILKPKGHLFLALQKGIGEGEIYWELARENIFINRYTLDEISKLLKAVGFQIIYTASRSPLPEDIQLHKMFVIARKK